MKKEPLIPQYLQIFIAFVGGMLLAIWIRGCDGSGIKKDDPSTTYTKTDTIYRDYYNPDTSKDGKVLPPKVITKYIHDTLETAYMETDTVYKYKIKDGDTVYFPIVVAEQGLIGGKFNRDSIVLDLYDTALTTKYYPVNFDRFKYEWVNGRLKQFDNPGYKDLLKAQKAFYTESNVYLLYDPFRKNAGISMDYSVMYKKVGLVAKGELASQRSNISVGLKIKIK